jgi:transposase
VCGWRWSRAGRWRRSPAIWGIGHEALRKRVRQAEADGGLRPGLPSSEEREEIRKLCKEVFELRRANEILKAASVFFAIELDADRPR